MDKIKFIKSNLFQQIDIHFADFMCGLENNSDFNLWLLSVFVSYYSNQGHSAFDVNTIKNKTVFDIFDIDENNENANIAIPDLKNLDKYNIAIGKANELKPLIFENGLFYLNKFHQYETIVKNFIEERVNEYDDISDLKNDINNLFLENEVEGQPNWQKVAAILALRAKFSVISGGPGTGKTTTVGKVLALCLQKNNKLKIKLVAPTGKAADRLQESINKFKLEYQDKLNKDILELIPENAETVHRFLGLFDNKMKYNKNSLAPVDLLLIDEASMVSLPLFAKIFSALPKHCKVILLGDKDQLMAVENGNVLRDITVSKNLNTFSEDFVNCVNDITDNNLQLNTNTSVLNDLTVHLEYSWRFKNDSGIGLLSKLVNETTPTTQIDDFNKLFLKYNDISIININENLEKEFVKNYCLKNLKNYMNAVNTNDLKEAISTLSQSKILCAVNDGAYGVNEINSMIEKILFPYIKDKFYHGQPILITENNYKLKLMNGDIGIIFLNKSNQLEAYFPQSDGSFMEYSPSSLEGHTKAFAISIHKSQGSEFENIAIVLPKNHNKILTKELIYTAITRAKKSCTIISSTSQIHKIAQIKTLRISGLKFSSGTATLLLGN